MLSAEDTTAVNIAIEVCNRPEIKMEILCTPESEYDKNKGMIQYEKKVKWNEIIEKKAKVILDDLGIGNQLREIVMGTVLLAGLRMLTWAEYHEGTLGISREYSFNFLNSSFFTKQGIIDNRKAAEKLMKDDSLTVKQKYKLACLCCFSDRIPGLYKKMTADEKKEFYDSEDVKRINQPELVKFWSYYVMSEVDKLKGDKTLDQYRLEKAVKSGSKPAVQYCLEKTKLIRNKYALIEAAVEVVKCLSKEGPHTEKNWVVFKNQGYKESKDKLWVPSDFYLDILCFLLSKMGEELLIEYLNLDVISAKYKKSSFGDQLHSRVLEYLLYWPYQEYFIKTVRLTWEFLPNKDFATLLLRICDRIKPRQEISLIYGEDLSYDYRDMLREFWQQSPDRYKRYVLGNHEVDFMIDRVTVRTKAGAGLILQLITLPNFTFKDRLNIELILDSATDQEIRDLIFSQKWIKTCSTQMLFENWELLDRLVLNSFSSVGNGYKKEFCFTKEAKRVCLRFIKNSKWDAADAFIKWSSLSEAEVKKLKKEIICSEDGRNSCLDLISDLNNIESADQFIRWCISSEEDIRSFRKELAFSDEGIEICSYLIEEDLIEVASEFINSCLLSESEEKEVKKKVAYKYAGTICEGLISDTNLEEIFDNNNCLIGARFLFEGGKWEKVEQLLTWCFSSEEEIRDFKKNVVYRESGKAIHFNLIKSSQFVQAETFFAWLGLSTEEVKTLKKETFFRYVPAREMFFEVMYGEELIVDYGSREEGIELLLRWFLTDKESVLEFKKVYESNFQHNLGERDEIVLEDLESMIEQRLKDLDEERMEAKRKTQTETETFNPSKRLCNLKI